MDGETLMVCNSKKSLKYLTGPIGVVYICAVSDARIWVIENVRLYA